MFVVYEMDGGYSGEREYVSNIFGPFPSEQAGEEWIKALQKRIKAKRYYIRMTVAEVLPPT
jgi:hypothetical protein